MADRRKEGLRGAGEREACDLQSLFIKNAPSGFQKFIFDIDVET